MQVESILNNLMSDRVNFLDKNVCHVWVIRKSNNGFVFAEIWDREGEGGVLLKWKRIQNYIVIHF